MRRGGVILYPTDTLWGIGCDACCGEAVRRVFAVKRRASAHSVVVLVADKPMLERYVGNIPPQARTLIAQSDPLTIIYPAGAGFAAGVCAANGSVAVRIPRHDWCRALIAGLGQPLVSTSANISGCAAPAHFADIAREIRDAVDWTAPLQCEGAPTRCPSRIVQIDADGRAITIR